MNNNTNGSSSSEPFRPIDLSQYDMLQLTNGLGGVPSQAALILPTTGKPVYSVYYDTGLAVCDVTYARLCKLLGLSCVSTEYGINMPEMWAVSFVSVSPYDAKWMPYGDWLVKSHLEPRGLLNPHDVSQHKMLVALQGLWWNDAGAGYVTPRKRFIKSNNGLAFFALGLTAALTIPNSTAADVKTPPIWQIMEETEHEPEGRAVAVRLAGISDYDLLGCIVLPEGWNGASTARDYLTQRLLDLKRTASKVVDAISGA